MVIVGVDTGGTFTDFIYKKGNKWGVYKILSTPSNPAQAVLEGLKVILDGQPGNITHGSTVATNAILERKGAITALITNKGFEDIIEIGRQNRRNLYDLFYKKNKPLVPSNLRFGIKCRINPKGEEVEKINKEEIIKLIKKLKTKGIESVAVCFLFSFLNNSHEKELEKYLKEENIYYCLSSEILPEFREYERTSTTVINAYVSPKMSQYISFIRKNLSQESKLRIMQSNGGIISYDIAMKESVRTILSGPAGGVVGAFEIAKMAGFDKLITFDMGGTSTDVALIDQKIPLTVESEIEGFPVKVPMIDIHTVGAGGGSIAHIDAGGALKVGPVSAGADPGPICYGKGNQITVTDANLYLGRLVPEYFLGGKMKLYKEKLEPFFAEMARKAGLTPIELAEGILDIANSNMERAIRVISVEKGYNPSDFILFSFGGAGGMHACFLAKLLRIPKVFIPKNPGILSAIGMILSDIIKDYSQTVMLKENISYQELKDLFAPLINKAKDDLLHEGVYKESINLELYLDMRYLGQSYEIMIPFSTNFREDFHQYHKKLYGYANFDKPIEIVNIRLRARGKMDKPSFDRQTTPSSKIDEKAYLTETKTIFNGEEYPTKVFNRDFLNYGNEIEGPAIIIEYSSTIVVPPKTKLFVDEFQNLIIKV
ncbi:5-oxoprolinase (ATP-hydrolyzing) [Thermodesulfatator indicus DSM 15286]|uniref:5-oxoprolinase (ATP-hydrolyzing) n=1 Tax=Thermodesulfatator indicus (strain DSM 15286 / JCM 11887 / CIR29812) TaxID=667014 RepID=F8ABB7_THEID|nr:hydantoinase/oxoprolinase family protein [Thermodesulfatator indicus]AEH44427.1 5-oxoprolinase (ATP-hydrolyzing) [Thermodesulfatator indicus DSM 15286]